ncbi:MAG: hypothetical protein D6826_12190 [Alphaproteobacteria bacterium]|nr:MAG: hypothetical protein D6826_12190 [Alphaproteobacteria bacterium]
MRAQPPDPASDPAASRTPVQSRLQTPRIGPSGQPLPRYASLRASKVNLRTGPGVRYPIKWVYQRTGLPVEVIDEFETWRNIRDWEGATGWIHQSMLSPTRMILVVERQRLLRRKPDPQAGGVALVEPGVVGRLRGCDGAWCRVEIKGFSGWLRRDEIYGDDDPARLTSGR